MSQENPYVAALDVGSKGAAMAFGKGKDIICYKKYSAKDSDIKDENGHGIGLYRFSRWFSKTVHNLESKPDVFVIEAPYLFRNPKTFALLNKYVGIAQREIARKLPDTEVIFMTPANVKTYINVPSGNSHKDRKVKMIQKVNSLLGLDLIYHSNKAKSDDDVADAIGLVLAYDVKRRREEDE